MPILLPNRATHARNHQGPLRAHSAGLSFAMNELHGLSTLIGNTTNLHGIKAPPEPADFEHRHEYLTALDDYWLRMNFWKVNRVERQQPSEAPRPEPPAAQLPSTTP